MDMVIANLFKHEVYFKLVGHDGDQYEPYIPSKGYHYISNKIENGESIGVTTVCDLYQGKLKPLFAYILSTIMSEIEPEIDNITIKVHLVCGEDYEDYDIVEYEFSPTPDISVTSYQSRIYFFPGRLLNEKFFIYVESYVYMVTESLRELNAHYEEGIRLAEEAEINNNELIEVNPPDETFYQERCVICLESSL